MSLAEIRAKLEDIKACKELLANVNPRPTVGCGRYAVHVKYPREQAVRTLMRLLENNPDCQYWTVHYNADASMEAIAFADEKHAVMFRLML